MATGTEIPGWNVDLGAPATMEDRCHSLPVILGEVESIGPEPERVIHKDRVTVSQWEFFPDEIQKMMNDYKETGTIKVNLMTFGGMPPTRISAFDFDDLKPYSKEMIDNAIANKKAMDAHIKAKQNGTAQ